MAKLLEMNPTEIYHLPIPLLNSMVTARVKDLKESRYRAQKDGIIDAFTENDYSGTNAVAMALNSLFGGSKDHSNNDHKVKNISSKS